MILRPSLYVHVPFCLSRCTYCDFHSSVSPRPGLDAAAMVDAMVLHLESMVDVAPEGFRTVYVGGGTPTVLPPHELGRLLAALHRFSRSGDGVTECTVEANPEDLDAELLDLLRSNGVNRLSLGVQSLEDSARRIAGRRGSATDTLRALDLVATRWQGRWSADLIYGMPGQTVAGVEDDVRAVAGRGAGHVSMYQLTLEEGTALAGMVSRGQVGLPDDDVTADMGAAAAMAARAAGFRRYEVSNWCVPGEECLHNQVYWELGDWYALGPSGVGNRRSADGSVVRTTNTRNHDIYCADPAGSVETEIIGPDAAMFEYLMLALRTTDGLSLPGFNARFGVQPCVVFGNLPARHASLLEADTTRWKAVDRGLDLLNIILVDALSEQERKRDFSRLIGGHIASMMPDKHNDGVPG